jgi:hypothetical protein
MTADLEALVVAGYVFADGYSIPAHPGRPAKVCDAELVALAACQAAIGISSDRQFLGLVGRILPGWFPHLPDRSQYNRRLRSLVGLISLVQQRLARWLDGGGVRLADGTQLALASYPGCEQRSHFRRLCPLRLLEVASSLPLRKPRLASPSVSPSGSSRSPSASCSTPSPADPPAHSPPTTAAKSRQASSRSRLLCPGRRSGAAACRRRCPDGRLRVPWCCARAGR